MGNFAQHTIIGFIVLGILYFTLKHYNKLPELTYLQIFFIILITYFYSNMPDTDLPSSRIHKWVSIALILTAVFAFVTGQKKIGIALAGLLIFFHIVHHRTLAHSLFFGVILSAPLWFASPYFAIIAFIMYTVHITSEGELSIFADHDLRAINFFGRQGRH